MFFILVMLIVQIGFLILARGVAATTVEAALRRAVVSNVDVDAVRAGLERDVMAVVPGAESLAVDVSEDPEVLRAVVRFRWLPPGPDFLPITVTVERVIVRVVPP